MILPPVSYQRVCIEHAQALFSLFSALLFFLGVREAFKDSKCDGTMFVVNGYIYWLVSKRSSIVNVLVPGFVSMSQVQLGFTFLRDALAPCCQR